MAETPPTENKDQGSSSSGPSAPTSTSTSSSSEKDRPATRAQGRQSQKGAKSSNDRPTPMGSKDRLTDIKAAQGPLQPTAVDAAGTERIIGPAVDDNWEPAPTEPTEEAIAHRKRVAEVAEARREERLTATQVPAKNQGDGVKTARKAAEAERGGKS